MKNLSLAATIFLASSAVIVEGSYLISFEILRSQAKPGATTPSELRQDKIETQLSELKYLEAIPGIRGIARELSAELLSVASSDARRLELSRQEVLKVVPASGRNWLELATLQVQTSIDKHTISSLRMSELTEPYEIYTLEPRLMFYLSHWEKLDEARRQGFLRQLFNYGPSMRREALRNLRTIIDAKSEATRKEIGEQILARLTQKDTWAKSIGLREVENLMRH